MAAKHPIGKVEDFTEQKGRLYDTFLSGTDDLAYLIDREGRFIFANRALLELWGMTLEEVSGKTLYELGYPKWHADMNMREFARILETKKSITGEVPYVSPTGVSGLYEYVFSPVLDEHGEVEVIAGTSRDVADRRQAAEEQRRLAEQLRVALESERAARAEAERASRMKDEFLATLSHELRTPLAAILGWAQILSGDGNTPEEIGEGVAVIGRNARAQAQIIEDLLEMSRIVSGKIRLDVRQLRLGDVVRAALATVQNAADAKRVRVGMSEEDGALDISGDENRLQQVFWNLLSNAVKFTPSEGRIDVRVARVGSHIEVSVADTGEGIRPEFLPFVFDRFRQADATTTRRHGGLGLGLAIVKQLVELHGGTVRVASEGMNRGTTFTVALPVVALRQPAEPGPPRSARVEQQAVRDQCGNVVGLRVLVVDDDDDARTIVRRFLEDCDVSVTHVSTAAEALERLAAQQFDVLLSDIGMPGEDGYTLIQKVRSSGNPIPAVALTAYARPEDRVRATDAGFQAHLPKPADPAELIAVVADVAGRT